MALLLVSAAVMFVFTKPSQTTSPIATSNPDVGFAVPPVTATVPADDDAGDDPLLPSYSAPDAAPSKRDGGMVSDAAFRTDNSGQLVIDEQMRLDLEALVAQTEAQELNEALREQTADLPPAAARRAEELATKFVQYQQAQRQAFPPDNAPPTPEDAIQELEGLHALREAHFGPDIARALYGREESIAREMIEVMRLENDESLTPLEKTERARVLREQLPGVASIEKGNREAAQRKEQP